MKRDIREVREVPILEIRDHMGMTISGYFPALFLVIRWNNVLGWDSGV